MRMASDTKAKIDAVIEASAAGVLYAGISAEIPSELKAEIEGVTGRGVDSVVLENGEIVFIMTDGDCISIGELPTQEIPIAGVNTLGLIKVGDSLKIDAEGRLSADVAEKAVQGDSRPLSGGAVYELVGNIETVLEDV